jgi:hypothetical protein
MCSVGQLPLTRVDSLSSKDKNHRAKGHQSNYLDCSHVCKLFRIHLCLPIFVCFRGTYEPKRKQSSPSTPHLRSTGSRCPWFGQQLLLLLLQFAFLFRGFLLGPSIGLQGSQFRLKNEAEAGPGLGGGRWGTLVI